ncbi:MAG: hypothetical protein IPL63_03025 [Saprospiraceae bacterium]|nr:hypothetical protein [Saprospiraceae bacterium]
MTLVNKFLIEVKYDDILVEEAEILFEKKVIIDVLNPEKNLFVFSLFDERDNEVEIFKPFTKLQRSTCSCLFHTQHKICKHVLAGLMFLRNQKSKEESEKKTPAVSKTKTLNISNILSNVSREELIQFVKNYAKSDPKFSLQLKVFFARKVDLPDNKKKYKSILDSVIKPHSGKSNPSVAEIRAFLTINKELTGQTEDCIALEQYEEATDIFEAVFYKFEYVRSHYGLDNETFTEQSVHWHKIARSFFQEKMSRALTNRITDFLKDLAIKSFYRYTDIFNNLIHILEKELDKKNKIEIASVMLSQMKTRPESERPLLMALTCLLQSSKRKNEILEMEYPVQLFLPFMQHLIKLNQLKTAENFLETKIKKSGFEKEWFFLLMDLKLRQKQNKIAFDYLITLYTKTGDIKYVTFFKNAVENVDWIDGFSKQLEKELLTNEKIQPAFLLSFFESEEKWDEQLSLLEMNPDITLYLSFASNLYIHKKEVFSKRLLQFIFVWLDNHVGENSYHFLQSVFKNIDKNKLFELKLFIKENIRKKYKERKGLITFLDNYR